MAVALADWITEELFTYRELHADPHAGNFACDDQGRLVIYDLGAVIPVPEARLKAMMQLLDATLSQDPMAMDDALMKMGGRLGAPLALYRESAECITPLFAPVSRISAMCAFIAACGSSPQSVGRHGSSSAPADTLLLSRALNGHYWNLVRLKARLDMHDRTQPLLGWARTA
ncbi:hypothetical protein HAALTHF_40740n [Vreelandella aquamarina]|nr:hypothetical protein HAALTHF_40740n [Halomonas axialensis]